jgi:hypothetical protein
MRDFKSIKYKSVGRKKQGRSIREPEENRERGKFFLIPHTQSPDTGKSYTIMSYPRDKTDD